MELFQRGKKSIFAAFLAFIVGLYLTEVNLDLVAKWKAEESAIFTQDPAQLFDYITQIEKIPDVSS